MLPITPFVMGGVARCPGKPITGGFDAETVASLAVLAVGADPIPDTLLPTNERDNIDTVLSLGEVLPPDVRWLAGRVAAIEGWDGVPDPAG